ncbi:MAG: sulfurtransferase [Cyanobacteria bacterium RYN_339]|nr:sulfurtransferase [Cyanobacteria bacterium RYN_339]
MAHSGNHSPAFLALAMSAKARVTETTVDAVLARRTAGDKFLFVDVREDHEWAEGHAAGAVHMGRGIIERDIEVAVPDMAASIVLYCGGGFRSALVADNLQKMGYTNVQSMDGGMRAWRAQNAPVEVPSH